MPLDCAPYTLWVCFWKWWKSLLQVGLILRPGAHWNAGGRRAGRRSTGNTAWHSVSAYWDAGGLRAGQRTAGRDSMGNTAWHSVSAHWEVVSCNIAKLAMAKLITLNSESDFDEEMDTLMSLYLTSKRQKSVWKSENMKKRKTHGEFALTSEFFDGLSHAPAARSKVVAKQNWLF